MIHLIWVLLLLSGLLLLGSSRMMHCLRIVAAQGILVGLLAVFQAECPGLRVFLLSATVIALKGFVFPWLVSRAIRQTGTSREVEPFVGYGASYVCGAVFFMAAMELAKRLLIPYHGVSPLPVTAGLFLAMVGLFIIVSRRKAVTQVLGYLTLENGIYAFGLSMAYEEPLLVELGVLLDVFAAVFVMGIIVFHIQREFDHMDTGRLTALRD